MADKRFTNTIEEKVALIAPTVKATEFDGDQSYLRELQTLLRQNLASLVVFFERDPGLDAANAACSRKLKHASRSASRPHAGAEEETSLLGGRTGSSLRPDSSLSSASALCMCWNPVPCPSHKTCSSVLPQRAASN
jgi:hypothetical protein